jgi:hypothetical protein
MEESEKLWIQKAWCSSVKKYKIKNRSPSNKEFE